MPEQDFPGTQLEFEDWFATEESCEEYVFALRWPNGFACPRCAGREAWRTTQRRFECTTCNHQVSITAGTIFHKTRKPLRLWFRAMWWVTSQKSGASALGLQRVLGLGSYQTAWLWLHKLRRAMIRPGRDRLQGTIEVDETYVGGHEEGVSGRETATKSIVVIAAEERGKGIGRIRLRRVPDVSGETLVPFVVDVANPGSVIHTDGWSGYSGLKGKGLKHRVTNITRSARLAHELMPRVHRVASLLKRWILGTHQGSVSDKHLDYYLDEFTFRFNRRTSRHRGMLFYRLMQQATALGPSTYDDVVDRV